MGRRRSLSDHNDPICSSLSPFSLLFFFFLSTFGNHPKVEQKVTAANTLLLQSDSEVF